MLGNVKLSAVAREIHLDIIKSCGDNYVLEFLGLPEQHHSESELQKGLISQMKDFILELGKDFLFIGEDMSRYHEKPFVFGFEERVDLVADGDVVSLFDGVGALVVHVPGHNDSCLCS